MGRLQTTRLYTRTILWLAPFADSEIYEYLVILKFLDRLWESNSYIPTCYNSNNLRYGSVFQYWCRTTIIGKDISHGGLKTTPIVGVKYTLCATPRSQTAASKSCPRLTIWPSPNTRDTTTKSRVRDTSLPPATSISKRARCGYRMSVASTALYRTSVPIPYPNSASATATTSGILIRPLRDPNPRTILCPHGTKNY